MPCRPAEAGVASGDLQRLPRGVRAARHHRHRRGADRRQGSALPTGSRRSTRSSVGYQAGLLLAAALVVAGGVAAFVALRRAHGAVEVTDREDLVLAG